MNVLCCLIVTSKVFKFVCPDPIHKWMVNLHGPWLAKTRIYMN